MRAAIKRQLETHCVPATQCGSVKVIMVSFLFFAGFLAGFTAVVAKNYSMMQDKPDPPPESGIVNITKYLIEKQLVEDLFSVYDPSLRPVLRREDNVTVTLGISAHQLIDVDERNQVIKISVWIRQVWYNPFLKWNKTYYGNIGQINVNPEKVWKPDIFLYTNADDSRDGSLERSKTMIKVNSDGRNIWLSPNIIFSSCKINVKYFPFDDQHCKLKFGSWTYNGYDLDLMPEASTADIASFVSNGEWDLIEVPCQRNEVKYVCCAAPYPDITFEIHIRRRTLFYLFNMVIPCLVIVGLTALSFYLPPESGERISLVITNLLAMTVFMLLVAEIIPPTSDEVSIISIFYSCCMFEVGLSLIGTCVILKYHFANPNIQKMPYWVKFIFIHCLGRLLLKRPESKATQESRQQSPELETGCLIKSDPVGNGYEEQQEKRAETLPSPVWLRRRSPPRCMRHHARNETTGLSLDLMNGNAPTQIDPVTDALLSRQDVIAKNLGQMVRIQMEQGRHEKDKGEWMYVAAVLDRVFLIAFIIILIISAFVVYTKIPSSGKNF